jgi:hypothetical protein
MTATAQPLVVVYTWSEDKTELSRQDRRRNASQNSMGKAMKREYDFSNGKRGPVVSLPKGKTRITIRLDEDVIA